MKLAAIFSLIVAIIYIIFQGINSSYYMHLYPDVFAFFDRASFFWDHQSLNGLGHNEYQPGAIIFFISLTPVFFIDHSIETFKWALFGANTLFLFLIVWILISMKKTAGIFVVSIFLIFLGPILLFRFDLLVIFLTILSFYLWEEKKKSLSMIILALGVITKVYPIIFLPYLLFQNFKQGKKLEALYLLLTFSAAFLTFLLSYTYFFHISLYDTWTSYNFHGLKSVATESVWASAIYFFYFLSGQTLPGMESAWGINAIVRNEVFPSIQFYNYFWIFPLGIFYLWYFFKKQSWEKIDYQFLAFITLILLIFYKVLCNQYLAWFLLMLPLIDLPTLFKRTWVINMFLLIIALILRTFIYPLNYSSWLSFLGGGEFNHFLFWSMLISSFLLVAVAVRMFVSIYIKKHD